jgi:inositol-phosphate phosphatase / L-galactose 1-phosphate phosphatase / histidinol-phosphatase
MSQGTPGDFVPDRERAADADALVPVIEGAGGIITDWQGEPLSGSSDRRVLAAGDRRVHAQALELLSSKDH